MPREAAPARLTDRKRAAILEAAVAEFRESGYEATSMDRIAASAGVSKRTVYNHFPTRDALHREHDEGVSFFLASRSTYCREEMTDCVCSRWVGGGGIDSGL